MTNRPIDALWRKIAVCGFCCAAHEAEARAMFFSGAMAAMNAMTGWDPAAKPMLRINVAEIVAVDRELTENFTTMEAQAQAAGAVHH